MTLISPSSFPSLFYGYDKGESSVQMRFNVKLNELREELYVRWDDMF